MAEEEASIGRRLPRSRRRWTPSGPGMSRTSAAGNIAVRRGKGVRRRAAGGRRLPPARRPPRDPDDEPLDADVEDLLQTDVIAGEGVEEGMGEEPGGDRPARLGFRGIPTWEEAVGMLITKNLEARARRPGRRPFPRPRQPRQPRPRRQPRLARQPRPRRRRRQPPVVT